MKISKPSPDFHCDCCGGRMLERSCKVICPNCGYRFDCSDLTLNFSDFLTVSDTHETTPSFGQSPAL